MAATLILRPFSLIQGQYYAIFPVYRDLPRLPDCAEQTVLLHNIERMNYEVLLVCLLLTGSAVSKDGGVEAINNSRNEKLARLLVDLLLFTFNTTLQLHVHTA